MSEGLKLGIATIGDLLLQNQIVRTNDGQVVHDIALRIPEYQRPYKWTARNANQLLDDIENALRGNKEVYRVGTLILHDDGEAYSIVDGQQRTITFALLLSLLDERTDVAFLHQKLSDNPYNLHNVRNNYLSLERRIKKVNDAREKDELKDYIENQCEMVVVITTDLTEAFQFFDSQNARGKALYPHDLLKAYHLREMSDMDADETEKVVKTWEDLDQQKLASLFNDYLYRVKKWIHGEWAGELNEQNIDMFKGLTDKDKHPYAQYYKGAFAYADYINHSQIPFVTGMQPVSQFQIDAPVIAGEPFFAYTKHYFDVLADIQNNSKYEGYLVNDNAIIKTLDLRKYKNGVGNGITRLMLDTAILLYADRFCPGVPSREDRDYLDQFVVYAFVWAYSMRAQYFNVGWQTAQNYILGRSGIVNSFNIYKAIADADSPVSLLNRLADCVMPIGDSNVRKDEEKNNMDAVDGDGVYQYYLHFFKANSFWR